MVLIGIYCESIGIGSEVIERPSGIRVPFLAGSFKKEVQVFFPISSGHCFVGAQSLD